MCKINCQNCCNLICSNNIEVSTGESMIITVPTKTLVNSKIYCLVLCQSFVATTEPVIVTDGNTKLPLLRCDGNYVRGEQLKARRKYKVQVSTTPESLIVRSNNLCHTCYVQPQITSTANMPVKEV